jgi:hypothetical protein
MGSINFESFNAVIDNINTLNISEETSRLGLHFEQEGNYIEASVKGNISTYYNILSEVNSRLISGNFQVNVTTSTGETINISLSPSLVTENGKDITKIIQSDNT